MSSFRRIGLSLLFLPALALGVQDLDKPRVWQNSDGREITASVLELNPSEQTAKMRRSDGLEFTIRFDQLAQSDAELLKAAANEQEKASSPKPTPKDEEASEPVELPKQFELKDVPMVKQKGSYCVPASAAMIAGFHGLDTDQDEIAQFSSAGSANHQGTNPYDMLLAMEKLGFNGRGRYWKTADSFQNEILPEIRRALVEQGPIYISFKSGVFGSSGHGCVIIGYNDRREEMLFHNPWGNVFEKDYEDVATQARGLVLIEAPLPAPIASEAFIERIQKALPKFDGGIERVPHLLSQNRQKHELVWCSRRDSREDKYFAIDTARDDGRKILDLAFNRNPAVIIPGNEDEVTVKYYFVTRPPEGGARFMVREITKDGWTEPELFTLGRLTRAWPTRIQSKNPDKIIWELPMIELHPDE